MRSLRNPKSAPPSNSVPRSGLRFGLPGLKGTTPGPTPPLGVTYEVGAFVASAAPGAGERPVVPYAARRRIVETTGCTDFQNGSWEITYEPLTLGRKNAP